MRWGEGLRTKKYAITMHQTSPASVACCMALAEEAQATSN